MRGRILAATCASALLACTTLSTLGHPIDEKRVAQIENCTTTRADLHTWFGEPELKGSTDGFVTLQWQYSEARGGVNNSTIRSQMLWVGVNEKGQVIGHTYNPTGPLHDLEDVCAEPAPPPL